MKSKNIYKLLVFFLIIVLTSSFAGCKNKSEYENVDLEDKHSAETVDGKDTLKKDAVDDAKDNKELKLSAEFPENINPLSSENESYNNIMAIVNDGLFKMDENYIAKEDIAISSELDKEAMTATITIGDCKFSNGDFVSSYDVIRTFEYIRKDGSKRYKYMTHNIRSIIARDRKTLVVNYNKPEPMYKYTLLFPIIKNPSSIDSSAYTKAGSRDIKLVTNGKYIVDSFVPRGDMILIKNKAYHKNIKFLNEKIHVKIVPDMKSRMEMIRSLDSSMDVVDKASLSLFQEKPFKIRQFEGDVFQSVVFGNNPIFEKSYVRNSMYKSINIDEIINIGYANLASKATLPLHRNDEVIKKPRIKKYDYSSVDIERLKKETSGNMKLNIIVKGDDSEKFRISEIIRDNLRKIGFECDIIKLDEKEYESRLTSKNFDLAVVDYRLAEKPEIEFYLKAYAHQDEKLRSIINKLENSDSVESYVGYTEQMEDLQLKDAYYIPLAIKKQSFVTSFLTEGSPKSIVGNIFLNVNEVR